MSDLTPETVSEHEFVVAFRGYDRSEVRRFLGSVAEELRISERSRDALEQRLAALTGAELEADIDRAADQIRELLHEARRVAEDMRTRAADETNALLADSRRWADEERRSAEEDAFALRRDAWETSTDLIEQSLAHASSSDEGARRDAIQMVGEAEREVARLQATSRREADEALRAARREAEELVEEARGRHDDIIENALRQSEAAQERIRALEQRRTELITEMETLRRSAAEPIDGSGHEPTMAHPSPPSRPGAADVISEPEDAGKAPPSHPSGTPSSPPRPRSQPDVTEIDAVASPQQDSGVRPQVATPSAPEDGVWTPGETVRVVRPSSDPVRSEPIPATIEDPDIKVITAGELARRRDTGATPVVLPPPEQASTAGDRPIEAEAAPESVEPDFGGADDEASGGSAHEPAPVGVTPDERPPADVPGTDHSEGADPSEVDGPEPEPEAPESDGEGAGAGPEVAVLNEVASLFDRLRTDRDFDPASDTRTAPRSAAASAEESVGATNRPEVEPAEEPEGQVRGTDDGPMRIVDLEIFDLRDRVLLPVTNRSLRAIKRHLMEHQNRALEQLRVDAGEWQAPDVELRADLVPELVDLVNNSVGAGHEAAQQLVGAELPGVDSEPETAADEFVDGLVAGIATTLEEARNGGGGDRQTAASVSRVFRVWRTDQAERRVRQIALAAYHHGLVGAMAAAGHEALTWRVSGRGCATCRQHGAERSASIVPPAHADCECTLAPLVAVR